jgi:RND superfamily putative drug exporter
VIFAAFALGGFLLMKMLGFALAVTVLIDATVVRMAIGPALLRLAGRWNWWPGDSAPDPASDVAGTRSGMAAELSD